MFVPALVILLALNLIRLGAAVRPVVTFTPNWNELIYNDTVTISCNVGSAALENQIYSWYKDRKAMNKNQQSFKIEMVKNEDTGDYQCKTNTSHLSPPVTLKATQDYVILQRPPVIYIGGPLTLRCHSAYGYNARNTTFYRDGKEIKFSVNDSELHIDTVDGGSSGTYQCAKLIVHGNDTTTHYYSAETNISVSDFHNIIIIGVKIGSVVIIITLIFIIFWKRRNKTSSTDEDEQADGTSMTADTHPEEDVCYTYLSLDRLRSASSQPASSNVDQSVIYAVVKH